MDFTENEHVMKKVQIETHATAQINSNNRLQYKLRLFSQLVGMNYEWMHTDKLNHFVAFFW